MGPSLVLGVLSKPVRWVRGVPSLLQESTEEKRREIEKEKGRFGRQTGSGRGNGRRDRTDSSPGHGLSAHVLDEVSVPDRVTVRRPPTSTRDPSVNETERTTEDPRRTDETPRKERGNFEEVGYGHTPLMNRRICEPSSTSTLSSFPDFYYP